MTWQDLGVQESVLHKQAHLLFPGEDVMREKVLEALHKPEYNVADLYHETGIWRTVATHAVFESLTFVAICINSVWIAVYIDSNPASSLLDAPPLCQVVEHSFCWYFAFELCVRFSAFKRKLDGLRDRWFVFDSCLVFMMVAETWVMTAIMSGLDSNGGANIGGAEVLRVFRLLRVSRLARMLRSMPELMMIVRGMLAAARSVFLTMCLLVMFLYVFALIMRQLTDGTPVGEEYFSSVPSSMLKLLIEGVFLDNLGRTSDTISASNPMFTAVFFVFVVLCALMVMNMLIGILVEVVSRVATAEKEEMKVASLRSKLAQVMDKLDENSNGFLSETEFVQLVSCGEAVRLLNEVGVDPIGLLDMTPVIFDTAEDEYEEWEDGGGDTGAWAREREISFEEFMQIVLDHRGTNTASLKDIRELKYDLMSEFGNLKARLHFTGVGRSNALAGLSRKNSEVSRAASESPSVVSRRSSWAGEGASRQPSREASRRRSLGGYAGGVSRQPSGRTPRRSPGTSPQPSRLAGPAPSTDGSDASPERRAPRSGRGTSPQPSWLDGLAPSTDGSDAPLENPGVSPDVSFGMPPSTSLDRSRPRPAPLPPAPADVPRPSALCPKPPPTLVGTEAGGAWSAWAAPPSTEAPPVLLPVESKVEIVPSDGFSSAGSEGKRGGLDMLEVERGLVLVQQALARVQRPVLPGATTTSHEEKMLNWAGRMSKTATSELEKLKRMQRPRSPSDAWSDVSDRLAAS